MKKETIVVMALISVSNCHCDSKAEDSWRQTGDRDAPAKLQGNCDENRKSVRGAASVDRLRPRSLAQSPLTG
ncbi:hypothetical protein, partial [Mesorhizobium sp.]|uniref:hypothetical protein n=1 Tax=Mesorhizobium sp. TaxID=1871066 RepID=UPI0025EC5EC7